MNKNLNINRLILTEMKRRNIFYWLFLFLYSICSITYSQQGVIISGQIKDSQNKESLIGVNIVEVDENGRFISGTVTDVNGNFSLMASSSDATIQVSYLGYTKTYWHKHCLLSSQDRL